MTDPMCTVTEEHIVDYVQDRLAPHDKGWLEAHLSLCATCRELTREWREVLLQPSNEIAAPARLGRTLRWKAASRSIRQWFYRGMRSRRCSMAAASMILLLLVIGLFRGWHEEQVPVRTEPSLAGSQTAKFLSQPSATKLTAYSESQIGHVRGELWLDEISGDVLLVVSGFGPRHGVDYQVWNLRENDAHSMGLLEVDDALGYFYAPGMEIHEVDQIVVSEEPKGGSRIPTGPEAIRIGLNP